MPAGEREYVLQDAAPGHADVFSARIIVEWDEELVMNGGPGGIGGAVELVTGSDAPSERSASGAPLPRPASVAIGVLTLAAGGLYVVRLRRG